jgi:hypothetical protein
MAADIEVIWVGREQEYFCNRGWTGQSPDSLSGKSVAFGNLEIPGSALRAAPE